MGTVLVGVRGAGHAVDVSLRRGRPDAWTGPEATALLSIESGGWFSRRALHQMIFGGVFERHPDLQLVLTEQPGDWWPYTLRELDSAWMAHSHAFRDQVPRLPSEYCARNVSVGSSFLAHFEAEAAVRDGYADKIMWGSDYPHMEGTYQRPDHDDDPSMSLLAMRHTFAGLDRRVGAGHGRGERGAGLRARPRRARRVRRPHRRPVGRRAHHAHRRRPRRWRFVGISHVRSVGMTRRVVALVVREDRGRARRRPRPQSTRQAQRHQPGDDRRARGRRR